jgi:hypothetical protein
MSFPGLIDSLLACGLAVLWAHVAPCQAPAASYRFVVGAE